MIEKEVPPPKKLRSAMETFEINQCHFCQLMSEGRLYDIMQDSYRYRTENEFRECSWSIKIFKHRSLRDTQFNDLWIEVPSNVLEQNNWEPLSRGIICINHAIFEWTGIFKITCIDAKDFRQIYTVFIIITRNEKRKKT